MEYDKKIMTLTELVKMGFSKKELMEIYRSRHQTVAWKGGNGKKNSPIYFSTEDLEKYRKSKCTGV